jgi:hypothetical protein
MTLPSTSGAMQTPKRTRSPLSAGLEKNLSAYAIAAGSAGVALLACVQPAEAKVVFTKTNIVIPENGGVVQFDINGDGQNDFGLSAFGNTSTTCMFPQGTKKKNRKSPPPLGCPFDDQLHAIPAQAANEIWQAGTSYGAKCANDVARGIAIGPGRPFGTGDMVMYADTGTSEGHQFCPWKGQDKLRPFLGVKFLDTAGAVHYGWVRVSVVFVRATIVGYAYETIPNKPILAGATSGADDEASTLNPSQNLAPKTAEPTALGHLALGATGLNLWRREQEVIAQ